MVGSTTMLSLWHKKWAGDWVGRLQTVRNRVRRQCVPSFTIITHLWRSSDILVPIFQIFFTFRGQLTEQFV